MVTKKIAIKFVKLQVEMGETIRNDINDAIWAASHNLYTRYGIILKLEEITDSQTIIVKMEIPDDKTENFKPGNHLRGISKYLLKIRPNFYKRFLLGKRLLIYWEI